jgi:hypothetical protein
MLPAKVFATAEFQGTPSEFTLADLSGFPGISSDAGIHHLRIFHDSQTCFAPREQRISGDRA